MPYSTSVKGSKGGIIRPVPKISKLSKKSGKKQEEKCGVICHAKRLHRIRKKKEENLPPWKEKWNNFNEAYLGWLEHFVDKAIPWLVLLLFFIILGEYASYINIFNWHWVEGVSIFFEQNAEKIEIIDQIIVSFFATDLYFNFFKKRTILEFIKTSFVDILAIAPIGLLLRFSEIGEVQQALHVAGETEKGAAQVAKTVEIGEVVKLEREAKLVRTLERSPRLLRLSHLIDFFRKKKQK